MNARKPIGSWCVVTALFVLAAPSSPPSAGEPAGDEGRVRRLDAEARERQARFHRQSFSTAPVDDILAAIEDEIPGIAEQAGVDLIVSKWRVAYRRSAAELETDWMAIERH